VLLFLEESGTRAPEGFVPEPASLGLSRLQRGFDEKKTPGEVLEMMMQYICTKKNGELALVGLMNDSQGVVVLKVNGRPVTCLDPEH
jgi:hypothetical protein